MEIVPKNNHILARTKDELSRAKVLPWKTQEIFFINNP